MGKTPYLENLTQNSNDYRFYVKIDTKIEHLTHKIHTFAQKYFRKILKTILTNIRVHVKIDL